MALRDMLVSLGIDVVGKEQLKEVDGALDMLTSKAGILVKAFVGIGAIKFLEGFVTDTIEMGRKVYDTAKKLGVGTDELQEFQYAASMVGMSSDAAARSLQFLERHIGQAQTGSKQAAKDMARLGLNTKTASGEARPMTEVLDDVAEGFSKLKGQPEKVAYAVKFFGRAGITMIPLLERLKESRKEFALLGGGLKSDFIEKAKEADRGLKRLGLAFDVMKSRAFLAMEPYIESAMGALMRFFRAMGEMSDHTLGVKTALIALAATLAVLFAPLLAEVLPVIAAFTALYLIFDDIFTMFEGGDSIIGRVIDKLFGKGAHVTFVETIKKDIQWLWEKIGDLTPLAQSMGHALEEGFKMGWTGGRMLADAFKTIAKIMVDFKNGDWSAIGKDIDDMGSGKADFGEQNKKLWDEIQNKVYIETKKKEGASRNPFIDPVYQTVDDSKPFDVGTNKRNDVNNVHPFTMTGDINVTVHGANTNDQTGIVVGKTVQDHLDKQATKARQDADGTAAVLGGP